MVLVWTMDELVDRVGAALAAAYSGAPNGRVRDLPDRRAIRWYTTIGLVDRPLGMRGRTALYGPRHLHQLVAVKRRQAQGYSLAQIQAELSGLSTESLSVIAQVPADLLAADGLAADGPTADTSTAGQRARFWAQPAISDPVELRPDNLAGHIPGGRPTQSDSPDLFGQNEPKPHQLTKVEPTVVTLGGGVLLLVPHPVSAPDRADIVAAAAPLLDLLAARGLTDGRST